MDSVLESSLWDVGFNTLKCSVIGADRRTFHQFWHLELENTSCEPGRGALHGRALSHTQKVRQRGQTRGSRAHARGRAAEPPPQMAWGGGVTGAPPRSGPVAG